ncbi:hypothetical protein PG995_014975 [Apiospora arundinis]|uniref:Uncharacterized protein n=1 Tax=Apiospora arundinis TaxID=335852 RepID=A0ABR2IGJ6_9PEZI
MLEVQTGPLCRAAVIELGTSQPFANSRRALDETTDEPDQVRIATCGVEIAVFYYKQDPLQTSEEMGNILESSVTSTGKPSNEVTLDAFGKLADTKGSYTLTN